MNSDRDYKGRTKSHSFEEDDKYYRQRKRSNYYDDQNRDRDSERDNTSYDRDHPEHSLDTSNKFNHDRYRERKEEEREQPSTCLRIRGLWYGVTETMISSLLATFQPAFITITDKTSSSSIVCFVEFTSVETASEVLMAYPGSHFGNGKFLELEGKCLYLSYARPLSRRQKEMGSNESKCTYGSKDRLLEWMCPCGILNYHARGSCRKCLSEKKEKTITVFHCDNLTFYISPKPTNLLVVQGLPLSVNETYVTDYFRKFAPVKEVFYLKDPLSLIKLSTFIIEFNEVSSAIHVKNQSNIIKKDYIEFWADFAEVNLCRKLLIQQKNIGILQPSGFSTLNNWELNLPLSNQHSTPLSSFEVLSSTSSGPVRPTNPNIPPSFELFGASYIFQPKSGIFHEPNSNFYYIPKLKIYYNGKTGQYLTQTCIDETGEIVFKPRYPFLPQESEEISTNENSQDINSSTNIQPIKPLSITLVNKSKTKLKPRTFEQNSTQSNIAKWGQILKEERDREEYNNKSNNNNNNSIDIVFSKRQTENPHNLNQNEQIDNSIQTPNSLSTSKPAQIICYVCRRQFSSQELLLRHEKESKLHAENLKKLEETSNNNSISLPTASIPASTTNSVNTSTTTNSNISSVTSNISSVTPIVHKYRDRAEERREMYGSYSDTNNVPKFSSSQISSYSLDLSVTPSDLTKDETNMGHQLLKRMGWNESNNKEALGVTLSKTNSTQPSNAGLGHDSRQNSNNLNQTMYYNKSGQDYKNVLISATKSRFDMLFKNEEQKKN